MAEFRIIHGRQSIKYDHFREYEFRSARAIATRLMGVTALRVSWRSRTDKRAMLYQIIHLDNSEYGVDEYREFECLPGSRDYRAQKQDMHALWDHFISVMGGGVVDIEAPVMMRLIADALPLAAEDVSREYDSDENRSFRNYARLRIGYMMEALHAAGFDESACSESQAIRAVMPEKLSAYETINYFIMRLADHDYAAASVLTTMSRDSLKDIELIGHEIQSLMRCNIVKSSKKKDPPSDGKSYPFRCRITTQGRNRYYYSTFVIWLSGGNLSKNPVVTDIAVGSVLKLSQYEAAMQLSMPEYITVFKCGGTMPEHFNPSFIRPLAEAEVHEVPNGWLYTVYKKDNSHVDSSEYRIEGDVMGHALLTVCGELVLMGHVLRDINSIDTAVSCSVYAPYLNVTGRYRIDNSVFQTLCVSAGAFFSDLIVTGEE